MSKDSEDKSSTPEDENTDYQYTASEIEALRAILENRKEDKDAKITDKDENGNNPEEPQRGSDEEKE